MEWNKFRGKMQKIFCDGVPYALHRKSDSRFEEGSLNECDSFFECDSPISSSV